MSVTDGRRTLGDKKMPGTGTPDTPDTDGQPSTGRWHGPDPDPAPAPCAVCLGTGLTATGKPCEACA